ncbi:MAG: endonuclease/exonuclease/phosphatase family protein [Candidatus Bilamarchaeum sp.]
MSSLKVMALNINTAHGPRGDFRDRLSDRTLKSNLDRIARVIHESAADVVCLQEVDFDWGGTRRKNQLQFLADATGLPFHHHQPHLKSPLPSFMRYARLPRADIILNRDCGTAIISRFPIVERDHYDFGQSYKKDPLINYFARLLNECKGYTFAELDVGGKQVGVYSVHVLNDIVFQILHYLGRSMRGETFARVWQVEKLLQKIRDRFDEAEVPIIVAGDFNTVPRESSLDFKHSQNGDPDNYRRDVSMHLIREAGIISTIPTLFGAGNPNSISPFNTYPGCDPDRVLDYIFTTSGLSIEDYRVIKQAVSDHLAVVATVSFSS